MSWSTFKQVPAQWKCSKVWTICWGGWLCVEVLVFFDFCFECLHNKSELWRRYIIWSIHRSQQLEERFHCTLTWLCTCLSFFLGVFCHSSGFICRIPSRLCECVVHWFALCALAVVQNVEQMAGVGVALDQGGGGGGVEVLHLIRDASCINSL